MGRAAWSRGYENPHKHPRDHHRLAAQSFSEADSGGPQGVATYQAVVLFTCWSVSLAEAGVSAFCVSCGEHDSLCCRSMEISIQLECFVWIKTWAATLKQSNQCKSSPANDGLQLITMRFLFDPCRESLLSHPHRGQGRSKVVYRAAFMKLTYVFY